MIALVKPDNRIDALPLGVVVHGECIEVMQTLPDNSLDACVVDPPYGLGEVKDIAGLLQAWINDEDDSPYIGKSGFMGKDWDAGVPGPRYWREVYRVLKPGAHILCFAGTRTVDLMTIALRLAGFQYRDMLMWIHGQGFPKSTDISKKLDKMAGAERKVIGEGPYASRKPRPYSGGNSLHISQNDTRIGNPITAPVTDIAKHYSGFGTALKPAQEPIILARKPLSELSIAVNVLRWSTGAINIDACRVGVAENDPNKRRATGEFEAHTDRQITYGKGFSTSKRPETLPGKRWPANLLLSHSIWCIPQGMKRVRNTSGQANGKERAASGSMLDGMARNGTVYYGEYEEIEDWQCAEDCPIRILGEQTRGTRAEKPSKSGKGGWRNQYVGGDTPAYLQSTSYQDEGSVSRYFTNLPPDVPFLYQSKASRSERNAGCEGLPEVERHTQGRDEVHWIDRHDGKGKVPVNARIQPAANDHPTCKPVSLMRWLIRLVTPPDGIVLDPFFGSGTTGVACVYENVHFIGIDQDEHYCQIAEARIAHARREVQS